MEHMNPNWEKTVFRLRGLPSTTETHEDVASLLSSMLGDTPVDRIRTFSLATTLNFRENPRSKVATVMFVTTPPIVAESHGEEEWVISCDLHAQNDLILDTHFAGMTPLNDVHPTEHCYDCVAISGLSSHPFGSWQPKGSDKTFMWIRDSLPKNLQHTRAILYGYDTTLDNSQSFQGIPDLAHELINQLQTYGWATAPAKPIVFLAHSLGGLVLKEALIQMGKSRDRQYETLLGAVLGAVFFGVPNLGMEQAHFRTIVKNNPNEALVDDIGRSSNYLRRLNEAFVEGSYSTKLRCFWAFETSESPTIVRTTDGKIDRNGPLAILVSRESATCRFVETDPSLTFPINATHSNMVKFARDSRYYHVVISKISTIQSIPFQSEYDGSQSRYQKMTADKNMTACNERSFSNNSFPRTASVLQPPKYSLTAEFDMFKRVSRLTDIEMDALMKVTYENIQRVICDLQTEQERNRSLIYMKRLEPFVVSMQQYGHVSKDVEIFPTLPRTMAYVWGSMEYILHATSAIPEVLDSILNAYQGIGEQVPLVGNLQPLLFSSPHLREVLVMIYKDILLFHGETIKQLKQRRGYFMFSSRRLTDSIQEWRQLFASSWRNFSATIQHIKGNIARNRRLIENRVSITEFEEIQNHQIDAVHSFQRDKAAQEIYCRTRVMQWLSPFNSEIEQDRHRKTRSVCKDPGRWLLNDPELQKWFNNGYCSTPLLWLSGRPGAGKTILASVVVDEARKVSGATVGFFYCKHGEETRNSFTSVARSMLAQMLAQNPHLLPYFYERASMSSDALLTSTSVAKDMIQAALNSCERVHLIIDGLDECGREERKEMSGWFQVAVETVSAPETDSIRCLFVSQDDGAAREDFRNLPAIKIRNENRDDLTDFAAAWHRRLESKFGELRSKNCNVSHIITARAQGMFIFAELYAKYLEDQVNRTSLLAELHPDKLPVKLDHVYERILRRIRESKTDHVVEHLQIVLGWVVCARRPLRWRELQGLACIDLPNQQLDYDMEISSSPQGLFASLVELDADGTVELVHETAREFLIRTGFVEPRKDDYSLALLTLGYLTFPQVNILQGDKDIESDLIKGTHALYDYASACWAMHLQNGISGLEGGDELSNLQETLETFIEAHWSVEHKLIHDTKRVQKTLSSMTSSELFDKIVQAVAWARKQCSQYGQGPSPYEALDLSQFTKRLRHVLENTLNPSLLEADAQRMQRFYGDDWFKCSRVNCYRYYRGFSNAAERDQHVNKHERPFLCLVSGCHFGIFGYETEKELKKHLFQYHGIDMFDAADDAVFPDLPKQKTTNNAAKDPATFQCHLCEKKFTRNHNLKSHLRTHEGSKPFSCSVCEERFTRKADCDRHERGHGDKKFICFGPLKSGGSWGCKAAFGRADKLADHFRSKTGQKCLQQRMLEKLQEGVDTEMLGEGNMFADEAGENADTLRAVGRALPSFGEFLRLCGLDESFVSSKPRSASPSKRQSSSQTQG